MPKGIKGSTPVCKAEGCEDEAHGYGLCNRHLAIQRRPRHWCVEESCEVELFMRGRTWPQRCDEHIEQHRKEQARIRSAKWRQDNPERARELSNRMAAERKDEVRVRAKAWYKANPERVAAYRAATKERRAELWKAYYEANRERMIQRSAAYAKAHPEWAVAQSTARYAKTRGAPTAERFTLDEVFARDGGRCALCGKRVARKDATADHIVPVSLGGPHSLANIQLAHRSCNSRKGNRPWPAGEQLRLT